MSLFRLLTASKAETKQEQQQHSNNTKQLGEELTSCCGGKSENAPRIRSKQKNSERVREERVRE
jgi:hypothetical protein